MSEIKYYKFIIFGVKTLKILNYWWNLLEWRNIFVLNGKAKNESKSLNS